MAGRRRRQTNKDVITGVAICLALVGLGLAVFVSSRGRDAFGETHVITTDFRTITGLRRGSLVQLAGIKIGRVQSIDFYDAQYECNPDSEDRGRMGQGRTNDCDPLLFCSPEGICGSLEPWTSKELHAPCLDDGDCGVGAICVTKPFRRRYSRVYWAGWDNVCARYARWQNRVQVTMEVSAEMFHLIREDSRAVVASNSVLGDQLVSITRGTGAPIEPGDRIQSVPSIYEDMEMFRERVEVISGKIDEGLGAISGIFGELNDERRISDIKDGIAGFDDVTRQIARGEGPIGGFVGQASATNFAQTLLKVNAMTARINGFVADGDTRLATIERDMQPRIDNARQSMAQIRSAVADLRNPDASGTASLLYDPSGARLEEVHGEIRQVRQGVQDIDEGRGTAGELVNDNDLVDEITDLFGYTNRSDSFREVNRRVLQKADEVEASRAKAAKSRPANK